MACIESGLILNAQIAAEARVVSGEIRTLLSTEREFHILRGFYDHDSAVREMVKRRDDFRQNMYGTGKEWRRATERLSELETDALARAEVVLARAYARAEAALATLSRYEKALARQALEALNTLCRLQHQRRVCVEEGSSVDAATTVLSPRVAQEPDATLQSVVAAKRRT